MITIQGRQRDLGDGFTVNRILPSAQRRLVGPFVFFDYFGPVTFEPHKGIDVLGSQPSHTFSRGRKFTATAWVRFKQSRLAM
jgi:redox-sensitive bicupin YhaK (pirin superfamily)